MTGRGRHQGGQARVGRLTVEQLVSGQRLARSIGLSDRFERLLKRSVRSDPANGLHAERALAMQAEVSYQRMVKDQQAGAPARKAGASATPERA